MKGIAVVGIVVLLIGIIAVITSLMNILSFGPVWCIGMIIVGVWLIEKGMKKKEVKTND